MTRIFAGALVAAVLVTGCATQTAGEDLTASEPAPGQEAALRIAATQWADAVRNNDAAALDRLMRPEFHLSGKGRSRYVPLAEWRANRDKMDIARYRSDIAGITYYGDVAVIRTIGDWKVTMGGSTRDTPFELADFWILDNGQWRIFRRHNMRE